MSKGVKITLIYIMTYKLHCQENILAIKYWEVKNLPLCMFKVQSWEVLLT